MQGQEQNPGSQNKQSWEALPEPRRCLALPHLPGRPFVLDSMGLRSYVKAISHLPCHGLHAGCPDVCLSTRPEALRFVIIEEQP